MGISHNMTDKYYFIFTYAGLMVVIVPIGVPAILFTLLWLKRNEIEERQTRRGGDELKYLAFLFRLYGREHWYYSTIDFYRRIILSSVVLSLPTIETIFMLVFTLSVYCVLMYREVGPYW